MKNKRGELILAYLNKLYPNAYCELNYTKDYELLLVVMLSAQTTDIRVNQVSSLLFFRYPKLEQLANADVEELRKIIKPIGTYRKKADNIIKIANRLLEETKGVVPNDRLFLESLPGVGRKTANVVLSNLFNEPVLAVDTHIKRVSNRLGLVNSQDVFKIEKELMKLIPQDKIRRVHHQLIFFGRYHCKARNPNCENCELLNICEYKKP